MLERKLWGKGVRARKGFQTVFFGSISPTSSA